MTRFCNRCQTERGIAEFNRKGSGYQSICRYCTNEISRAHYRRNKADYLKRSVEQRKNFRKQLNELKNVPCTDCGNRYPAYVMQFDHLSDKEFNVSQGHAKSFASVLKEIEKCEIVCANCHAIRTFNRSQS